jgi:hypothetical protein
MPDHDPRTFPDPAAAPSYAARLHELANASLTAATGQEAAQADADLVAGLRSLLEPSGAERLTQAFATAPSAAICRHLWRMLVLSERASLRDDVLGLTIFAIPLVIVAGQEGGGDAPTTLSGVLDDAPALAAILREHGALGGSLNFTLANVLVGAPAIELPRLPELLARRALPDAGVPPLDFEPVPMVQLRGQEAVHLRFLVGGALSARSADLLAQTSVGAWGMPFTQAIGRQLSSPGLPVLALPRTPQPLSAALRDGRAAHREVAAQLFASNAIRKLRASVGEPTAVISMHRAPDAPGGGEIRLSLSSPFDSREAEGFRCPLFAFDRIPDVVTMLVDLLRDCRVNDVRVLPGVHGDRDAATGLPLLFKAENLPEADSRVH